jgi:pimeloyl-ACP methyl ester carboxylesterase
MTDASIADRPAPPAWFSRAVTETPDTVDVHRDGRAIRVYRCGDPAGRPVVLLHGFGANAHWWDRIAPQLIGDGLQIAAVDLAGHGASDLPHLVGGFPGRTGRLGDAAAHTRALESQTRQWSGQCSGRVREFAFACNHEQITHPRWLAGMADRLSR